MTTRDISDNIKELYGFEVAVVFLDGMYFNIKNDGAVMKASAYALIGVDMDVKKEKYWGCI